MTVATVMPRVPLLALILTATVGCDQVTKHAAAGALEGGGASFLAGTVRLVYVENPGAFLSWGAWLPWEMRFGLFTVAVATVLAGVLAYALTARRLSTLEVLALGAIAGGGLGNWIDRLTHGGHVVDFVQLAVGPFATGVFNGADAAITTGVVLVLVDVALRQRRRAPA